jgi:hypothetical protein
MRQIAARRKDRRGLRGWIERLEERTLLSGVTLSGVPNWTAQGPAPIVFNPSGSVGNVDGAIEAVAVDPGDPNTIFVGTVNGGIWKTTDANVADPNWNAETEQFPSLSISTIEFSPLDSTHNTLYAGTGDDSAGFGDGEQQGLLMRTTDGGNTWTLLGADLVNQNVNNIVPTSQGTSVASQTVLAATSSGVWRSTDGGQTFTQLTSAQGLPSGSGTSLIVDPHVSSRFFVAIPAQGVFVSNDYGASWTNATGSGSSAINVGPIQPPGQPNPQVNIRTLLAMYDDGTTTALYAAIIRNNVINNSPGGDNHDPNRITALYRSTDLGVTWRLVQNLPTSFATQDGQAEIHAELAADPTNSAIAFIGAAASNRFQVVTNDANPANDTWNSLDPINSTQPHDDPRTLVFDSNNNMLEGDDGGIYRLVNPDASNATRVWQALDGTMQATEFYSVSYDSLNGTVFGGTQDNGSPLESSPNNPTNWLEIEGGDGGLTAVDNNQAAHPGTTIDYTTEGGDPTALSGLERQTVNSSNMVTSTAAVGLAIQGTSTTLTGAGGLKNSAGNFVFDNTLQAIFAGGNPFVLNAVDPTRMMIGTNFLYESLPSYSPNAGDTLVSLGGTSSNSHGAFPTNPIGHTVSNGYGGTTAIAYGGMFNGIADPNVAYVGTAGGTVNGVTGDLIRRFTIATPNTPALSDFTVLTNYPGASPRSIALDPTDDRNGFVLDSNNQVYSFVNGGTNASDWTNITGDLTRTADLGFGGTSFVSLRTIAVVPSSAPGGLSIVVGGAGGVFVTNDPHDGSSALWAKLGLNLPNAIVKSLTYVPPNSVDPSKGNILLAGFFGSGAWTLANASTAVSSAGILTINGDQDYANEDDTIKLIRDPANPLLLDVYLNSTTPVGSYPIATIQQINVNGLGGNDTLIVDSSNGLIDVPNGIRYDGGTGDNSLELLQTGGTTETSDTYTVITNPGQGSDVIVGASGTQTVDFQNLAPVYDNVPAPLTVVGTLSNNTINYEQGPNSLNPVAPYNGDSTGLVTVDNFEALEFSHKTTLTLQGQNGDDSYVINNTTIPTGLTAIDVVGGPGNSTLVINVNNNPFSSADISAIAPQVPLNAAAGVPVPITYSAIANVHIINSMDALTGTAAAIPAVAGVPLNNVVVASFKFTDQPPAEVGNPSDFLATIDWGDPSPDLTAGTIVELAPVAGVVTFEVLGTHTYTTQGTFTASVTIYDKGSSRTFTPTGATVPVTITANAGATTAVSPIASAATVASAPITATGTPTNQIEGISATDVVATFVDPNPGASPANYPVGQTPPSITINWGDGKSNDNTTNTTPPIAVTPTGTQPDGVVFSVSAPHIYAEAGNYTVTVTIVRYTIIGGVETPGSEAIATSNEIVADAPLSPVATQPIVTTDEATTYPTPEFGPAPSNNPGQLFSGPVAFFTDANTLAPTTPPAAVSQEYKATIDWGDGTPQSAGTVTYDPTALHYVVTGTHTYATSGVNGGVGHYPITVYISEAPPVGSATSIPSSKLTITNVANVTDNPINVTGILNPLSDSGLSTGASDVTNVTQPDFHGTVLATLPSGATVPEAYAHVSLTATNLFTGVATSIGTVQAGSEGGWNIKSTVALADGRYKITATAVDQFGQTTTAAPDLITSPLLIDATGPVIAGAFFNPLNGQVDYIIKDPGSTPSGVWLPSILDSSNYLLTTVHGNKSYPGKWIVTDVTETRDPTIPYAYDVAVTFNSGAPIKGGYYLFTIRDSSDGNSSVQDLAENHLDGEFFGSFPSGNGINGSDFVAELEAVHGKIFAPQTIIGTAFPGNGGDGGPAVAPIHSGIFVPVLPRGASPIFSTSTSPSNGADPPAATRHRTQKARAHIVVNSKPSHTVKTLLVQSKHLPRGPLLHKR